MRCWMTYCVLVGVGVMGMALAALAADTPPATENAAIPAIPAAPTAASHRSQIDERLARIAAALRDRS